MVAARLKPIYEEEARKRMLAGVKADPSANLRGSVDTGKASDKAAAALNVSPRSVESAAAVLRDGAARSGRARLYDSLQRSSSMLRVRRLLGAIAA